MPYLRQTSAVGDPASCSLIIAMICSSENLERIIIRLHFVGMNSTQKWRSFKVSGHGGSCMVLTDHEKSRDQQPGYQENKRHQQHDWHRRHWLCGLMGHIRLGVALAC